MFNKWHFFGKKKHHLTTEAAERSRHQPTQHGKDFEVQKAQGTLKGEGGEDTEPEDRKDKGGTTQTPICFQNDPAQTHESQSAQKKRGPPAKPPEPITMMKRKPLPNGCRTSVLTQFEFGRPTAPKPGGAP